jgi:hypothetical protein
MIEQGIERSVYVMAMIRMRGGGKKYCEDSSDYPFFP